MKSGWKKRLLTLVLCAALMVGNSGVASAMDEGDGSDGFKPEKMTAEELLEWGAGSASGSNAETQGTRAPETGNAVVSGTPVDTAPQAGAADNTASGNDAGANSVTSGNANVELGSLFGEELAEYLGKLEGAALAEALGALTEEQKESLKAVLSEEVWNIYFPAEYPEFSEVYDDGDVRINVYAPEGVLPEGVQLSVVPIVQNVVTDSMSEEEKAAVEEVNAAYEETEKLLHAEAEAEEKVVESFLAYDISFLAVDEETGETIEIEPTDQVQVSMEFIAPKLPEEVSEDAVVEVKHLEENAAENVVEVVDITPEAEVVLDDTMAVEMVAFASDSFSTFTITWVSGRNERYLKIHFCDMNGHEWAGTDFDGKDWKNVNGKKTITEIDEWIRENNKDIDQHLGDRILKKATTKVWEGRQEIDAPFTSINFYTKNSWLGGQTKEIYALNSNNRTVKETSSRNQTLEVWFWYEEDINLKPVKTTSTKDVFNVHLFNYDGSAWNSDINRVLNFHGDGNKQHNGVYNNWDGTEENKGQIFQGLVNNKLNSSGYPELNYTIWNFKNWSGTGENDPGYLRNAKKDLGELFNLTKIKGVKDVYEDVDYLFYKDEDGYYCYDSSEDMAIFDTVQNRFYVYEELMTPNSNDYPYGNFFPFNSVGDLSYSGKSITVGDEDKTTPLYKVSTPDFHFGMTMDARFVQPNSGLLGPDKPMVFEFRGDDDVWVFIDGVLVLDIGGIHDAHSGSIDFNSGEVVVETVGEKTTTTTLRKLFEDALGGEFDPDQFTGNTFKNYTEHEIKFFYLERGAGASNCKLKFNIPAIPEGSVMVNKEVVNEAGKPVSVNNVDYKFQILKNNEILSNAEYTVCKDGRPIEGETGRTDANGYFYLKDDEGALFGGFDVVKDVVNVIEEGAYLKGGYRVEIEDVVLKIEGSEGGSTEVYRAESGNLPVKDTSSITFVNHIINTADLYITKELTADATRLLDSKEEFKIQVKLGDKLAEGTYSIDDVYKQFVDGCITLPAGKTARITGLAYGTKFEIKELVLENAPYELESYEFNSTKPGIYDGSNSETASTGYLKGDGGVIVTNDINTEHTKDITVVKEWQGVNWEYQPDSVTIQVKQNGQNYEAEKMITKNENQWEITFPVNYYIQNNGTWEKALYTVEETKIGDETLEESPYKFVGVEREGDTFTIINTAVGKLTITKEILDMNKVDFNDGDPVFTFKIVNEDNGIELYQTVRFEEGSANTQTIEIEDLPVGRYTVTELETMRFICVGETEREVVVEATGGTVAFQNKPANDDNFSHTDVVENFFTINEDGSVEVTKKLTSTDSTTNSEEAE